LFLTEEESFSMAESKLWQMEQEKEDLNFKF
jgi:hypothetical protein